MDIVLIAPPVMDYRSGALVPIAQDESKESPPYGIYLLSSILKSKGYSVTIIDLIAKGTDSIDAFVHEIASESLIGIGTTSLSWPAALSVIRQIRASSLGDVPIVLGGIHASMFDGYILLRFPVDFVIRGEAEEALLSLCEALERANGVFDVPNLSWLDHSGNLVRNPMAPKLTGEKLSSYPLPDYELIPEGVYKGLSFESSRGCAFDCSFCSTSYRRSWRGMPVKDVVNRFEGISSFLGKTRFGTTHIIDDEFSTSPKRAIAIVQEMERRDLHPQLVFDSRANDLLYPGYVETIAPYAYQFLIGAECGYQEGLERIGKGTTLAKLEKAAAVLSENGIADRADFSFVLGFPWEGAAEVERTVAFAAHLFGDYGVRMLLQWYCQMPGSRLWDEDHQRGIVSEALYDDYGFFRNLYLFRSGVKLTPDEIWDIEDRILRLQWLSSLVGPRAKMVENAFPPPILKYFPRETLPSGPARTSGLTNLREIARPSVPVGIPQK